MNSIFYGKEAREKIKSGVDKSVNAIKVTLGGCGKTVVIFKGGVLQATKDGVTVAREVYSDDPIENVGITAVRNVTELTLELAGDGTTATALIIQKILELGFNAIHRGVDQIELKKGIDLAVEFVTNEITAQAQQVGEDNDKIKNIATISANNDAELGKLISDAFKEIGNDGTLFIEESKSINTSVKVQEGFKIDRGYMSPLFCTPETMEAELVNPYILFYDGKIDKFAQVKPILDAMMKQQKREILIICDNVESEALQTLAVNRIKGVLNVVCVNAPHFGERRKYSMEDMAAITGGIYISVEKGIKEFDISHCGVAEKILITKNETTIIGSKGDKEVVEKISNQIDALINQSESDFEITMLKQRKAKVKGKLAVISVGAPSETEMKEKKDRVEDAVRSVECAIELGIVPGGGIALLRCAEGLDGLIYSTRNKDQKLGVEIVRKAIEAPIRQILENAGVSAKGNIFKRSIIDKILLLEYPFGYNVKKGMIEDLLKSGVIDAAKVVITQLTNAASVAGTIITSESLIC